ncbi:MAG TPA: ABC transporter substrate-binding protein [Candidatus Angelobacter sp.]|nr:ABC transporter substrate-binding protein [Candidatus Angelobacter sp.]
MNHHRVRLMGVTVTSLLVLAACGTTTATTTQPVSGGTLNVAFKDDPKTLDPAVAYDTTSWAVERSIYNGLLDYKGFTTQLAPDIAEAMPSITNGGKTYTFKVRKGVKFSNGREVTADDFKYSWERMLDPKTQGPMTGGSFWGGITGAQDFFNAKVDHISGIKVIDANTLEVDLDAPNQSFLNIVAMPFGFVIPKEAVAAAGADFSHKPVGTGPFTLDKWTAGQLLVLKKNPNYFGKAAYLNEVDFQIGVAAEVGFLRLQNGQADLVQPDINMPSAQYIQLNSNPTFKGRIVRNPNVDIWYLGMNVNMAPFDNKLVREAFNNVVNKTNQLKVLNGRGVINNGIQAPPMPGYVANYNPLGLDKNGQNLDKAKALLTQAGYGASHPFPAQDLVYAKANADSDNLAASIQQDFQAVGITINLKGLSFPAFLDITGKPNSTALSYNGWIQDFPDPSDFIDPILTCAAANVTANGGDVAFYCNKQLDQLADQARGDTNATERLKLYQQIQDIVAKQDFPWVPMYSTLQTSISGTRVHDYALHPVWPLVLTNIWLTGGK